MLKKINEKRIFIASEEFNYIKEWEAVSGRK